MPGQNGKRVKLVPYAIVVDDFNSLAADTTDTTSPAIDIGPYPFVWVDLVIYSKGDTDDVDIDEIRDQGASINFLKESTHIFGLIQGSNGNNNVWELSQEYRFEKHTSITMQVTNNDAANAADLEFVFRGYLVMEF